VYNSGGLNYSNMVGRPYKITKKEKNIFLSTLIAASVLAILGNLFVSSFYDVIVMTSIPTFWRILIFFLSGVGFVWIIYWLNGKIVKNKNN